MDIIRENAGGMTGLEQLQALAASGTRPPIMETMDFQLVGIESGKIVFEGKPDYRYYNPIGSVHGGYAATLLDSACGCAVHSALGVGQGYTTLELKIAYHRGMTKDTGIVRAEGKLVSIGRRTAFSEAKLIGEDGKLYASASSTLLVFDTESPR